MNGQSGPEKPQRFSGPPPSRMAVAGGQLILSGPEGYCIDRESSQEDRSGAALVVLSPCRDLGGSFFARRAPHEVVMTAAVGARPVVVAPQDLLRGIQAFAATPAGQAALSRSGRPKALKVNRIFAAQDVVYLRLTDETPFPWGAVQPDYWRAVLSTGGRVVSLSVLARPQSPLSEAEGLALLQRFVDSVKRGSALPAASG